MNESFSPSTEQRSHSPSIENAPVAMQIDRIDEIVGHGESIDSKYKASHPEATPREVAVNRHHAINNLLQQNGIDFGESDQAKADYEIAYKTYESALSHDKNSWLYLTEEENTLRPRDVAYMDISQHFANANNDEEPHREQAEPSTDNAEAAATDVTSDVSSSKELVVAPEKQKPEQLESAKKRQLTDADRKNLSNGTTIDVEEFKQSSAEQLDRYAELIAKRSRSSVEGTKTGKGIETAGAELSELLAGIASEMYAEREARGMDHAAIVKEIDKFIESQTELTLAKIEEHRLQEYANSRPYMQKMYDRWANWSDDKKLKGGRGKKMAVMAGGGLILGAALGPLVGAVGAGVVTGAVAIAGTRSIGRHLANGFMKNRDKRFAQAQTDEMQQGLDEIYAQNNRDIAERNSQETVEPSHPNETVSYDKAYKLDIIEFVNARSSEYRSRNLRRIVGGTAIALSVGLISASAADALADADWDMARMRDNLNLKNPFGNPFRAPGIDLDMPNMGEWFDNDVDIDGDGLTGADDHDRDGDGTLNRFDVSRDGMNVAKLDHDGDGIRNWMDHDHNHGDVTDSTPDDSTPDNSDHIPNPANNIEISEAARFVVPNEGGFQTLKELHIPENKWEVIWQDAGTKLHDQGKTYVMDDGRWGWSRDMRLSNNDISILTNAAKRHGVSV